MQVWWCVVFVQRIKRRSQYTCNFAVGWNYHLSLFNLSPPQSLDDIHQVIYVSFLSFLLATCCTDILEIHAWHTRNALHTGNVLQSEPSHIWYMGMVVPHQSLDLNCFLRFMNYIINIIFGFIVSSMWGLVFTNNRRWMEWRPYTRLAQCSMWLDTWRNWYKNTQTTQPESLLFFFPDDSIKLSFTCSISPLHTQRAIRAWSNSDCPHEGRHHISL